LQKNGTTPDQTRRSRANGYTCRRQRRDRGAIATAIEQLALQLAAQPVERAVAKLALAVQLGQKSRKGQGWSASGDDPTLIEKVG
jgi:hypothetical protein